jgi:O-acetyl-ADP-ribose deacetylase (regulator of RNase III)
MKETTLSDVTIELKRGDIASQEDIDAVVNAANAELRIGGGVAGAIHRAAGPELTEETRSMAPIKPGEAVISGGHNLPNDYIIHCLGPVYGRDKPEDKLLSNCYSNALELAEEHQIERIAFPAISTGAFGYPMRDAAQVAFETIRERVDGLKSVELIRFVLWGEDAIHIHEDVMDEVFGE